MVLVTSSASSREVKPRPPCCRPTYRKLLAVLLGSLKALLISLLTPASTLMHQILSTVEALRW